MVGSVAQTTEFGSGSVCVNDARVDQAATGRCLELLCVVRWWVRLAERLLESFRTWRWPLRHEAIPSGTPHSNPPEFRARQERKICLYRSVEDSEIQAPSPSQTLIPGINGFVPQPYVHRLSYRNIYANDPPLLGNLKISHQLDSEPAPIPRFWQARPTLPTRAPLTRAAATLSGSGTASLT
jgi:hypothetical protein